MGLEQLQSIIAKTNKAFMKANKARKRVMIAKDVIKTLDAKEFNASKGSYLYSYDIRNGSKFADKDKQLQKALPTLKNCEVCAKGALLVCTIMRRDHLTIGEYNEHSMDGDSLSEMLGGIFEPDQLDLIERYFEGWLGGHTFYYKYTDSGLRLKAIMRNIIANQGTFDPVKGPV